MKQTLGEWFEYCFLEICEHRFGFHETSTDYDEQICYWECWGCSAKCQTCWPEWEEPLGKHERDCRYLELMKLLNIKEEPPEVRF